MYHARCSATLTCTWFAAGLPSLETRRRCGDDPNDEDADPYDYLPNYRLEQMDRLEGHGHKPTDEELACLKWPHTKWWNDRDRIVLLYEHILDLEDQPDGSFEWERAVADQALSLWSDLKTIPEEHLPTGPLPIDPETGEVSLSVWSTLFEEQKAKQRELARKVWPELADNIAPGWRMLTSLPSCPNAHLRFPMSPAMLRRVRANACA